MSRRPLLANLIVLCLVLGAGQATASGQGCTTIRINEVRIDEPGTDVNEYFELRGPPGFPLTAVTYIVIGDGTVSQGSGVIEMVLPLAAVGIQPDGLTLVVENTFTLLPLSEADLVLQPGTLNFEDNDNVTHMIVTAFSGSLDQDLDTNDDGVLDITPWNTVLCSVALLTDQPPGQGGDYVYSPNQAGPVGGSTVPGYVQHCPDTGRFLAGPFDPADGFDTPGAENPLCCPADIDPNDAVDVLDLLNLLADWGKCPPPPTPCDGDINGDGTVDVLDLLMLLAAWGPCP